MPTYLLEWSPDPLSDTTPTYINITAYALEVSYQRDGGGDLDDPQAGTMQVTLKGAFFNDYLTQRPLQRMRFSIDGDLEFTGFVNSWGLNWPDKKNGEVSVSCVDGRHLLELEALPGLEPLSASTHEEVVSFDQPWGYWRLGEPEGTKLVSHVRKQKTHGHHNRTKKQKYKRLETVAQVEGVAGASGTYKGLPTLGVPGLILGDQDTAVQFDATLSQYARVGPIDKSDMVDGNRLTLEAWIKPTAAAGIQGIVSGPFLSAVANPVWVLYLTAGNTILLALQFTDGTSLTAESTATVADGTLAHVVGTWGGATASVYVNGALEDSESASSKRIAQGDDDEFVRIGTDGLGNYFNGVIDEVAIYEKDIPPETVLGHYIAGSARGWNTQLAGDRIEDILTHDLWATGSVDSGTMTVQPQMKHGQTMLEEADRTMECERPENVFYFSGAGNPVYLGWGFTDASPYNTVQATFGDGPGEIPYTEIAPLYDEEIYNEITVARDGGDSQVSSDSPSQDEFLMRRYQSTGLILSDDDDAGVVADTILDRFRQPAEWRPQAISLNGANALALAQIKLREPGQLVRVKRRQGARTIDRICRIQSKSVSVPRGTANRIPVATFGLTRGFDASVSTWHLGVVGLTELDTGTVLAA